MKTRNVKRTLGLFWWIATMAVFGAAVMLLWNWIIPAVFGLAVISYWQALGLLVLVRILFGGIGVGHKLRGGRSFKHHHAHEGNPIREKWMTMTPEERKEFIKNRQQQMGGRCGKREFFNDGRFDFGANTESDSKE